MATAARRWPVARDRSPAWFGTCSEGFLWAPVARAIFLPQDVHMSLPSMIAVAGGGTNVMDVSKNVRAWRCTRCPARLQACCPGRGLLLLVAWASADVHKVLLQQPHVRNPIQSSRASCLGIISLGADSKVAAAASCLCLSPGYDGASRHVRRKGAAPFSGAKEQTARAISAHAQCACLLSLQMGSIN